MAVQAVTATALQSVAINTKTRATLCAFTTTACLTFVLMLVPATAQAVGKVPTAFLAAAAVAGMARMAFWLIADSLTATLLAIFVAFSVPIAGGLQAAGVPAAGSSSEPVIAAAAQPLANALQAGGISLDACTITAVESDKERGVVSKATCNMGAETTATFRAYDSRALLTEAYDTRRRRMGRGHIEHHRDYRFRKGSGQIYAVITAHRTEAVWWLGDGNLFVTMTRLDRNRGALIDAISEYAKATREAHASSSAS